MYASEMSGCLVESINADKKRTGEGKVGQAVCRTLIEKTHHCTFSLHAQASLSANHPIHPQ